ncbi:MAG: 2-succinyl-5-enolpyruvyl-6-hydroxy-3-cyclohexene-1-carboxylic-acid synthase [Calditrichaeota bacterium]|nr:MAG: 2-succinyl-5-enolpyruvyl-6-hydroxy-3-cyclohexene-1-carboxylic-acid synthase [Calditrichota bacterium]MBL1205553.1 2-succinyl-5-enolpyruvyl-6-hydroxy-3-cyclohexene-1-carboxylic-acid synthase [Calditrichota bacterium]NOG45382.1 2-succinyl-5-enolpyruvyl-6-hydroxy-3-cyclohexene-1-carboxylic-acid synthase [Calditrichota bacterium]
MSQIQSSENINILWANLIIEELVRHGIDYFCISPGSRSTPLTIAAARHPKTNTKIIYDERGAAFHALGFARANRKPAVLICTSGTAAANYYPAVIEASQEYIPMIILSADRPTELRNTGANQTINQVKLFGDYPRFFFDLPCPGESENASFVLTKIDDVAEFSSGINPGPVHLNCMFREPLEPKKIDWSPDYLNTINHWLISNTPYKKLAAKSLDIPNKDLQNIVSTIEDSLEGIILAGRCENKSDQQAVLQLSKKLNWPVFADITSGLRLSPSENIINHFDQLFLSGSLKEKLSNLPILHFGGQFVSKRLLQFLEKHQGQHIHILETEKTIDPAKNVSLRIQLAINEFVKIILPQVSKKTNESFIKSLLNQNLKIIKHLKNFDKLQVQINEVSVARIISEKILPDSALFLASSMPVRDMDMFAVPGNEYVKIGSNRGASGIDGTIASAIGFACGSKKPATLIIGDLAFLHDMNSLAMVSKNDFPLTIILINNQGGGIFSFLPIAEHTDVFEENFGTPHNLTFKKAVELFGLAYFQPGSVNQFAENYKTCQEGKKSTIIEVRTNRNDNFLLHKKLQNDLQFS